MSVHPDPSHADILARLDEADRAQEARVKALAARLDAFAERLEAGSGRFALIQDAMTDAARLRENQSEALKGLSARLEAIELARAVQAGVDDRIRKKVARWKRVLVWLAQWLLPPGFGFAFAVWLLDGRWPS